MAETNSIFWVRGMFFLIAAGAMQGGFPLPMKYTMRWKWENIWLASSVLGLFVIPWFIAMQTIPALSETLYAAPPRSLAVVALFGAGWGIGGLLFGQAVHRVGLTVATGTVLGLTSAVGSVAPMAVFHPNDVFKPAGMILLLAVIIGVAGITFTAWAGAIREQSGTTQARQGSYAAGAVICVLAGLLSPLFNFALICGDDLVQAAKSHGATAYDAPNVIWAVAMSAGLIPTIVFCAYELRRNDTWRHFTSRLTFGDPLLALLMGVLFAYGNSFYGTGAEYLGEFGSIFGWPVFMSIQVITGTVLGIATAEWRGASRKAGWMLACGSVLLIVSVFLVGQVET